MTAAGSATATPMANEVSQAGSSDGANPTRTIVSTSDITNDMTVAMIAGSISLACFLPACRASALACPGRVGFMTSLPGLG